MSSRDLARVGLKLMGIFWLVSASTMAATTVPLMLSMRHYDSIAGVPRSPLLFQYLMTGVLMVSGLVLLLATEPILKLFFRQTATEPVALDSESFQAVAISLLGAWLFVFGLSAMGNFTATTAFSGLGGGLHDPRYLGQGVGMAAEAMVQAGAGIWLFFNGKGIAKRWHKRARA